MVEIIKLLLAIIILLFAFYFRLPFWASWRVLAFSAIIIFGLGLILSEIRGLSRKYANKKRVSSFLIFAIASLALSSALALEIKFNLTKFIVLNADGNKLEKLGQHFVIGYRNYEEIKTLVSKKAVGGVFITTRNIKNKTKQDIQQEIKALQDIRQSQGLPPLWIATDQEGGMISRLSPPLTRLPQLSTIVADDENIEQKKDEIIKYARTQGRELAEVGVNLNFAPVVDLNKGIINPNDKYSKIYQRSISADKEVVAKVALWYCKTLEEYGVRCTIKHFPGLGRVSADTHIADAELPTSVDELTNDDWVPFRQVMRNSQALTMLGHAKLTAVDPKHPVSFSKRVVTDIIRKNWQHNGILITDDFGMQAVYGSKDGFGLATVKAINAGVDLLLISYDKDLYYKAMYALLKASERGNLDREMLEKSRKRLELLPNSI